MTICLESALIKTGRQGGKQSLSFEKISLPWFVDDIKWVIPHISLGKRLVSIRIQLIHILNRSFGSA
jgi:hypothetical protein